MIHSPGQLLSEDAYPLTRISGLAGPCSTMTAHAALGVVRAGVTALKGSGVRINCISAGDIETTTSIAESAKVAASRASCRFPQY